MVQQHVYISSDPKNLNVDFIHNFISNSYWGKGRTLAEVQTCMDHSLNFGVYLNGKQIGYARVVTDYVAFAYLMDVFIDEAQRGNGYSIRLMEHIMNHDRIKNVRVWRLATTDAQALYEKFGFKPLSKPERMMEKLL